MAIIFVIECEKQFTGSKFEKVFDIFFNKIVNCNIIRKKDVYTVASMASSNEMLVKGLSSSKLATIELNSKLTTSSANENESKPANSLTVKGDKIDKLRILLLVCL